MTEEEIRKLTKDGSGRKRFRGLIWLATLVLAFTGTFTGASIPILVAVFIVITNLILEPKTDWKPNYADNMKGRKLKARIAQAEASK